MSFIKIKCNNCGADINVDENAYDVTCEYCNCKTVLKEKIQTSNSVAFNPFIDNNNVQPNIINNPMNENNNVQPNIINNPMKETTNNQQNNNNSQIPNKPKKKNKKNNLKIFLYFFFSLIIIASAVIWYIEYTKPQEEPEIYSSLPSEIKTEESEKTNFVIESKTLRLAPDVDLDAERKRYNNNDIIGRLEIPDLFNVLVTQTTNNEYYLSHSVKKESDIRGTEFLDYRITPTSKQLNIYGHNTRDENIKVAFLKLEKFLKEDFFNENEYIVFQHDGGKNIYKILAIKEIRESNNEHMYVDYVGSEFVEHVRNMTTGEGVYNTRNVHYDETSEILVLQTCSHHWDNGFYIITAVKV